MAARRAGEHDRERGRLETTGLLHGCWTEENRTALEKLIGRDRRAPGIAVFDWDNTCIRGDIGDAVFHQLAADLAFQFQAPGFWDWVTEANPVDCVGAAYEDFRARPGPDTRLALRFAFERARTILYDGMDDNSACAWDAGAFLDWREEEAREYARQVVLRELTEPLHVEVHEWQNERLEMPRGIRIRPELRELIGHLQRAGWEVWVISASAQWVVEPFAALYNIPANRVVGMRRAIVDGCFARDVEPPISFCDGKLDAYQMFVTPSRPPTLAAGDSLYDWKLLEWAEEACLLVEPTHEKLRDFAQWERSLGRPWLIQRFE